MTVAQTPWAQIFLDAIVAKSTVPQGSLSAITIVEYHTLAFKVFVFQNLNDSHVFQWRHGKIHMLKHEMKERIHIRPAVVERRQGIALLLPRICSEHSSWSDVCNIVNEQLRT